MGWRRGYGAEGSKVGGGRGSWTHTFPPNLAQAAGLERRTFNLEAALSFITLSFPLSIACCVVVSLCSPSLIHPPTAAAVGASLLVPAGLGVAAVSRMDVRWPGEEERDDLLQPKLGASTVAGAKDDPPKGPGVDSYTSAVRPSSRELWKRALEYANAQHTGQRQHSHVGHCCDICEQPGALGESMSTLEGFQLRMLELCIAAEQVGDPATLLF